MLNYFVNKKDAYTIPIVALNKNQLSEWLGTQDQRMQNFVKVFSFDATYNQIAMICNAEGKLEKVLVGMGNENDFSVFGTLAQKLPEGVYEIGQAVSKEDQYQIFLSWGLGYYQFTAYKKPKIFAAKLYVPENERQDAYLKAIIKATYLVRDLINTPADDMMPADLAEVVNGLADELGGTVQNIIGEALLQENYPTIYTVGRGSEHPSYLIDLRWGESHHPKITLVGKGVCFDSGGLDIKPASGMITMKKDMGGAAHVIGLAYFIMSLRLPIQLRVLIPAVENAISGSAYHPGDIIVTRKGLSVEVTNTDAEGRLVLCDALFEAANEKPQLLLDFATLTGAARVALGTDIGALFTTNDDFAQKICKAGEQEKDPIWRMPLYPPYRKLINSNIADIANAASGGYGGAITAALFLKEFVPEHVTWAHFDIMAWNVENKPTGPEGGEALSLRAVARYLYELFYSG